MEEDDTLLPSFAESLHGCKTCDYHLLGNPTQFVMYEQNVEMMLMAVFTYGRRSNEHLKVLMKI
jgi:hypothetical protein